MFDKFDWAVVIIACLFFVLISQTLMNIWSGQKSYSLVSDMSSVNESNDVYFEKLLNNTKSSNKVVTTTSITTTTMRLSVFNSNGTMVSLFDIGKRKNIMINCGSDRFVSDLLFNYGLLDYLILLKDNDDNLKACYDILFHLHINKIVSKPTKDSLIFRNMLFLINKNSSEFISKYGFKEYGDFNYSVKDDYFIGNYGKSKFVYIANGSSLSSSTYDIDYLIIDNNVNISESMFSNRKIGSIIYSDDRDLGFLTMKYGVKDIRVTNGKYKEINVSFQKR